MKSIMRLLPFVLGVLIIILLVMHFVLGDGNDDVNTTDGTNKVSETELTIGGNKDKDDEAIPTPTKKPAKDKTDKNNKDNDKKEDDANTEPDATPTPIINDNEVIDDGTNDAAGTGNEFGLKFDEKQDFVFIKAGSRIRAGASTDTGIIGEVSEETKLERTGYNSEWTRVIYNQMECYVATSLVLRSTTDASETPAATPTPVPTTAVTESGANGFTFEAKSDLVEVKAGSRIRAGASTNSDIVAELTDDAIIDRTGYNKEWTRVNYNGKECYVATQLVKRTVDKYGTTVDENGKPAENTDNGTGTTTDNGTENTDNGNTTDKNDNDNNSDSDNSGSNDTENSDNNGTESGNDGSDVVEEKPVEITFSEKSDYVEIKAGSRIRSSASVDSDDNIVVTTSAVSRVKRTGSSREWARVEYNGQTCYISNSVITVSMSEEQAKAADEADRIAAEKEASENAENSEGSDNGTAENSDSEATENGSTAEN